MRRTVASAAVLTLVIASIGFSLVQGGCVQMDRRSDVSETVTEESAVRLVRAELPALLTDLKAAGVRVRDEASLDVGEPLAYYTLSKRPRTPPIVDSLSSTHSGVLVPVLADGSLVGVALVEGDDSAVDWLMSDGSQYSELARGVALLQEILGPTAETRPVMSMVDFVVGSGEGDAETVVFCGPPQGMHRDFSVNGREVLLMHPYTGEEAVDALRGL